VNHSRKLTDERSELPLIESARSLGPDVAEAIDGQRELRDRRIVFRLDDRKEIP